MRLMSNNFIIWQKQSKEVFCFFRIPWNVIKIHLQAHRHKVPPVCSMRSNEKTRTWASRKGRDMTCCRVGGWVGRPAGSGGQAVAYLSIPVPTNLRQAICFQLDTNQEMAPLKYPIGSAKIPYWLKWDIYPEKQRTTPWACKLTWEMSFLNQQRNNNSHFLEHNWESKPARGSF